MSCDWVPCACNVSSVLLIRVSPNVGTVLYLYSLCITGCGSKQALELCLSALKCCYGHVQAVSQHHITTSSPDSNSPPPSHSPTFTAPGTPSPPQLAPTSMAAKFAQTFCQELRSVDARVSPGSGSSIGSDTDEVDFHSAPAVVCLHFGEPMNVILSRHVSLVCKFK